MCELSLPCCHAAALQCCRAAALQCCHAAVLPCCRVAVLPCCSVAAFLLARAHAWQRKASMIAILMNWHVNHSIGLRNHHAIQFNRVALNVEDWLTFEQQVTIFPVSEDLPHREFVGKSRGE